MEPNICYLIRPSQVYLFVKNIFKIMITFTSRYEKIKYDGIPGITFCFINPIILNGLSERYPELKTMYDNYTKLMEYLNSNEIKLNVSEYKKALNVSKHIYKYFTDYYSDKNLPISDYFDPNITIPMAFNVELEGLDKYGNEFHLVDSDPLISSVINARGYKPKCFTFFSQLKPKWRRNDLSTNLIKIVIRHNDSWYPSLFHNNGAIFFSIHSANATLYSIGSNNFHSLKMGYEYEMYYLVTKTQLLPPNYETMCREYDPEDSDEERSRSDCRIKCFFDKYFDSECCLDDLGHKTKCDRCLPSHILMIRTYLTNLTKLPYCNRPLNKLCIKAIENNCENKCRHECYYNHIEIYIRSEIIKDNPLSPKPLRIQLYHNDLPDTIVTHSPAMTTIEFLSNFAGLLEMWLGLSAVVVLEYLFNII